MYTEIIVEWESKIKKMEKVLNDFLYQYGLGWTSGSFALLGEKACIFCIVYDCDLAKDLIDKEINLGRVEKYEEIELLECAK